MMMATVVQPEQALDRKMAEIEPSYSSNISDEELSSDESESSESEPEELEDVGGVDQIFSPAFWDNPGAIFDNYSSSKKTSGSHMDMYLREILRVEEAYAREMKMVCDIFQGKEKSNSFFASNPPAFNEGPTLSAGWRGFMHYNQRKAVSSARFSVAIRKVLENKHVILPEVDKQLTEPTLKCKRAMKKVSKSLTRENKRVHKLKRQFNSLKADSSKKTNISMKKQEKINTMEIALDKCTARRNVATMLYNETLTNKLDGLQLIEVQRLSTITTTVQQLVTAGSECAKFTAQGVEKELSFASFMRPQDDLQYYAKKHASNIPILFSPYDISVYVLFQNIILFQ